MNFFNLSSLLLFGSTLVHAAKDGLPVAKAGDEVCVQGFVMDRYCIDLGVLFENRAIATLGASGPLSHSVHCLIDVPHCLASSFEVVNELEDENGSETRYGREWRLDDNTMVRDWAYANAICADCESTSLEDAPGKVERGLRMAIRGFVEKGATFRSPAIIRVEAVDDAENFENLCAGIPQFAPPRIIKDSGRLKRLIIAHGGLMMFAWGFLLPSGAILARFGKHRPDGWWFKLHRIMQPLGLVFAIAGWGIALHNFRALDRKGDGTHYYPHAALGMTVMILGILQPFNALIRPHPPKEGEEKTMLRFIWEILHKRLGWLTLLLAIVTIAIGTTLDLLTPTNQRNFQIVMGVAVGGSLWILMEVLAYDKNHYKSIATSNDEDPGTVENKEVMESEDVGVVEQQPQEDKVVNENLEHLVEEQLE
jgi:hypothetical protein